MSTPVFNAIICSTILEDNKSLSNDLQISNELVFLFYPPLIYFVAVNGVALLHAWLGDFNQQNRILEEKN